VQKPQKTARKRVGESDRIFIPIRLTHEQWARLKQAQITQRMSLQEMGIRGFSLVLKELGLKEL
jgi:hypothetical protein